MKNVSKICLTLIFMTSLCPLLCIAGQTAEIWRDDFPESQALAKQKGLPLLIWFTGSDWCLWCQKLHAELFAEEAFKNAAGQDFIPVIANFPRRTSLPLRIEHQNRQLRHRFKVDVFPTVIWLCPRTGKEIHRHSYVSLSVETYLAALRQAAAAIKSSDLDSSGDQD